VSRPLKITYLTAGAAGMICGSCLHDNTLARALAELGHDVQLVPLYTPIRTDEENVTVDRVFYGGINMYLQQKSALFRWLPKWLDRWLDRPSLINWASGGSVKIDPVQVADLALSILRGTEGNQRKEVERLVEWLAGDLKPDIVVFSNILTAGCVPEIKRRMNVPVVVTLQGDDIFLRELPEPQQSQAIGLISILATQVDGFIANSRYYADYMAEFLSIPRDQIAIVPLGIDTRDFVIDGPASEASIDAQGNAASPARAPTIGYLARLAPEKGLHILAQAFILLRRMPGMKNVRLKIAGWLGGKNIAYANEVFAKLRTAGLDDAFEYAGEVDRRGKLSFLRSIDVLSVPTTYREPKGLFVLEALAAGVPVIQPDHGAFPEVLADLGGGHLHRPEDPQHLAERLAEVLRDLPKLRQLGRAGQTAVHATRHRQAMAQATATVLTRLVEDQSGSPQTTNAAGRSSGA
jgi:glycosyltransferase involved in cell wall biosynthesis